MVSLRNGPRKSYNVAEKLALSDDEPSGSGSGSDASNAEAGPSNSGKARPSKRKRARAASAESSGADSAFVPPSEDEDAPEDVEIEDADADAVAEAEAEGSPEPGAQEDIESSDELVPVKARPKPVTEVIYQSKGEPSSAALEYAVKDPRYQLMAWHEADWDPRKVSGGGKKFTAAYASPHDWVPHGPFVPLGKTRLASAPRGRALAETVPESEDLDFDTRQRVLTRLGKFVAVETPWDAWEGDPWRPDGSAPSSEKKGEQRAKPKYSNVGRFDFDSLRIITEEETLDYVPLPMDKNHTPGMTCLMGPTGQQQPVHFNMFETRRVEDFNSTKSGFIFMAGGPIWGLDWCPMDEQQLEQRGWKHYLAVSTLPSTETTAQIGEKWPRNTTGCIQIWSMLPPADEVGENAMEEDRAEPTDPQGRMRCEMVLCIEGGSAMDLKWMPTHGGDEYEDEPDRKSLPKLGILAATLLDGTISIFSVPDPAAVKRFAGQVDVEGPVYVKLRPIITAEVEDTMYTTLEWQNCSRLAAGCSNGHIVICDIERALLDGRSEVLPSIYKLVAQSSICSVVWLGIPDVSYNGETLVDHPPPLLLCGSIDGSINVVDTRDTRTPYMMQRARVPLYTTTWIPHLGMAALPSSDYGMEVTRISMEHIGRGSKCTDHLGPIWTAAASDYHAMLATGGADGALAIVNAELGARRTRRKPIMKASVYEMDYDRRRDLYKMTDDLLPQAVRKEFKATGENTGKTKIKTKTKYQPGQTTAFTWPPEASIHKAVWNSGNGLARAGLLLSGGASGLARIDVIKGAYSAGRNVWDLAVTRGEASGVLEDDGKD